MSHAPAPWSAPERWLASLDRHARNTTLVVLAMAAITHGWMLREAWLENPFSRNASGDAAYYWTWAARMAAGEWTIERPFLAAPLYPYLLGCLRALDVSLLGVYVLQAVALLAGGYLCGCSAARILRPAAMPATTALVVFARDPAFFDTRALHATLQLFLVALCAWELARWRKPASTTTSLRLGLWLGLNALANPPLLPLVPIVAAWIAWSERALKPTLALLLAGSACVLPATLHNLAACGEWITLTSHGGVTFAHGNGADADGTYHPIAGVSALREQQDTDLRRVAAEALGHEPTWSETNQHFLHLGLTFWRERPFDGARVTLRKLYWFFTGRNYGESYVPALELEAGLADALAFTPIQVAWFALPGLLGLALLARRDARCVPLLAAALGVFAMNVVFFYSPRYRVPAVPLLAIGATGLALRAMSSTTSRTTRAVSAATFTLALATGPINAALGFDRLEPLRPMFESNLGQALFAAGQFDDAQPHLRAAVDAGAPYARGPLAEILRRRGERDAALALLQRPPQPREDVFARRTLGVLLAEAGRVDEARVVLERLIADYPNDGVAVGFLGNVAVSQGRPAQALEFFDRALVLRGPASDLLFNRANALRALGREAEALTDWRRALALDPRLALARFELIEAAVSDGRWSDALELARTGAATNPEEPWLACRWALLLATAPDDSLRDGARALEIVRELEQSGGAEQPEVLDALAAALADTGHYPEAVATAERALAAARTTGAKELATALTERLAAYRASRPYRAAVNTPRPAK